MEPGHGPVDKRPAELGLWDAVSVIVGIVVGVSIFKAPPTVFSNVGTVWLGLVAWGLGGVVALVGALCYAELAAAYPGSGADYIYLTRAFGPLVGFLFAWTRLAVILTGNIAALSYVFADYAVGLFAGDPRHAVWFACAAVAALTIFNVLGLKTGRALQNVLSVAKVLGLAALLVAGLMKGSAASGGMATWGAGSPVGGPGFGLAMVLVLYAYGGWNDAVFVAADVREPRRNMPRALILGTLLIAVLYVLVNAAFVAALGFDGLRKSSTPAAEVLGLWLGGRGEAAMSLMVMVSALGAVSGLILAGSRLHATVGADYRIFSWMGSWNTRHNAPVHSLLAQAGVSLLLIVGVGTEAGRGAIDRAVTAIGLPALPWKEYSGGFDTLVAGTSPLFWFFFLLTGLSLLVLRWRDPDRPRPFSVPLYPVVPLVFIGVSVYMLYASVAYARALSLLGLVPLVLGIPLYAVRGSRLRSEA